MTDVLIRVGPLIEVLDAEDADRLLGELDRPRAGAAGADAAAAAEMIRNAGRDGGTQASFDGRYGRALLAAIDNLERASMGLLSPELMALQRALRELL